MEGSMLSAAIAALLVLVILDGIWLGAVQRKRWNKQVSDVQGGSKPRYNILGAIVGYIIMITVIVGLAVSRVRPDHLFVDSLSWGALTGLAMYGVFNATNYTLFKDYHLSTAFIDTSWGIFLTMVATFFGALAAKHVVLVK